MLTPLSAAVPLRQTVIAKFERRLEERGKDPVGGLTKFIQRHAVGNQRIVMWPDRPAVVTQRIKDALLAGDGAPAPSGKHVIAHEALRDRLGALQRQHARE